MQENDKLNLFLPLREKLDINFDKENANRKKQFFEGCFRVNSKSGLLLRALILQGINF